MIDSKRWILRRRPVGGIAPDDLEYVSVKLPSLRDGEVLLRNVYLSIDPTYRLWMSDRSQYTAPVELDAPMRGLTLGVVEASLSKSFKPGDVALPKSGAWESHTVAPADMLTPVRQRPGLPLSAYLSVLGSAGRAAYFGTTEVVRPKPGETVVVTAAAGATGSIAGQIAKIKGARVVGIARGDKKCRWLTEELGFDAAINYADEDVGPALDRLCPNGVDAAFENVGGPIMNAIFERMNDFGRIAICGLISTYNSDSSARGPDDFGRVLMRRLTIQGFINGDYRQRAEEAYADLAGWIEAGRLKWKVDVIDGLENALLAMDRLFKGEHDGKLLLRISAEPAQTAVTGGG